MKTMTKITLAIIGLTSASAHAIVGGVSVDESLYQQYVTYTAGNQRCSGTIVGGKYILSAAHCMINANSGSVNNIELTKLEINPQYITDGRGLDIAIATIEEQYKTPTITFLSDLHVLDSERVDVFGWSTGALKSAVMRTCPINPNIPEALFLSDISEGHTDEGDSGSPVVLNNKIISIHGGKALNGNDTDTVTSRIESSRDFILSSINDWHSPTELKFTGAQTIEIQSLHVNNTNLAERWNAADTLTTGDVTVTGGTCVTDMIAPFGTCTLDVTADAGEGKIKLTDNNIVTINRAAVVEPDTGGSTDKDNNNSGGGGGSLGWLTLLALLPLAWRRK